MKNKLYILSFACFINISGMHQEKNAYNANSNQEVSTIVKLEAQVHKAFNMLDLKLKICEDEKLNINLEILDFCFLIITKLFNKFFVSFNSEDSNRAISLLNSLENLIKTCDDKQRLLQLNPLSLLSENKLLRLQRTILILQSEVFQKNRELTTSFSDQQ